MQGSYTFNNIFLVFKYFCFVLLYNKDYYQQDTLKYIMKYLCIHQLHGKGHLYHLVKTMRNAFLVKKGFLMRPPTHFLPDETS